MRFPLLHAILLAMLTCLSVAVAEKTYVLRPSNGHWLEAEEAEETWMARQEDGQCSNGAYASPKGTEISALLDVPIGDSGQVAVWARVLGRGRIIAADLDEMQERLVNALRGFGVATPVTRGQGSRHGRYVTFHATVTFDNDAMMKQALYALSQVSGVRMVL